MAPLTAAEVQKHPEFPHAVWKLTPSREGTVAVAKGRGGPLKIYYQVHGRGPRLVVLVMGLGSLCTSWQRQYKDFGHEQADKYSVLVMDNRGIGRSDKPLLRYTTNEMARDVIEVVNHIGWTAPRSLNIVGVSMGGMIAQELAWIAPKRIASLVLLSTAAEVINTVSFLEHLKQRINMFMPKSLDKSMANTKRVMFTPEFLAAPDATECTVAPFPTNGDRVAAHEILKRTDKKSFTRAGFITQAIAAGWHKKTPAQLATIGREVGHERILVSHGSEDKMLTAPHGQTLHAGLEGNSGHKVEFLMWQGVGHVVSIEKRKEFNAVLAEFWGRFPLADEADAKANGANGDANANGNANGNGAAKANGSVVPPTAEPPAAEPKLNGQA